MSNKAEKILILASNFEKKAAGFYDDYYEVWLMGLKRLVERKGLSFHDFDPHEIRELFDKGAEPNEAYRRLVFPERSRDEKQHPGESSSVWSRHSEQDKEYVERMDLPKGGYKDLFERPSFDEEDANTKSGSYIDSFDKIITKFAQGADQDPAAAKNRTDSLLQSIQAVNSRKNLTPEQASQQLQELQDNAWRNLQNKPPLITNEQFTSIVNAVKAKREEANTPAPAPVQKAPAQPAVAKAPAHRPTPHRKDVEVAQQKLNSMIMSGILHAKPLDPDGKLGPLTRGVLKAYKAYLGIPSMDDELAIKGLNAAKDPAPASTWKPNEPVATWATPPKQEGATPAEQIAQNDKKPWDPGF